MTQPKDAEALKEAFVAQGGTWTPAWETVLKTDPVYFAAYLRLRSVPVEKKKLPKKIQELILLAVDAACTTLYQPGIEAHTAAAIAAGASAEEIVETLQLSSVLGIHAMSVGVPLLMEVLEEQPGQTFSIDSELDAHQQELKADFRGKRGYWGPTWDALVRIDPDFFAAYTEFSSVPFRKDRNALSPKVKELVYCAIDCSTTHLYGPGLKLHIRNAMRYGATTEEVMEVFELASLIGVYTVLAGAQVLADARAS